MLKQFKPEREALILAVVLSPWIRNLSDTHEEKYLDSCKGLAWVREHLDLGLNSISRLHIFAKFDSSHFCLYFLALNFVLHIFKVFFNE